jgi:uncharacterized protein involved in outer membrane biogenesis
MTMPHRTRFLLAIGALLVSLPVIALIVVLNFDWNRARPWLNERASEAIGRPFAIHGDLSLTWERGSDALPEAKHSWRDYLPWPHLVANDVRIGNPVSMMQPAPAARALPRTSTAAPALPQADMAKVDRLAFSLNPLALLERTISIPELRFDSPQVLLERRANGSNNWTFDQKEQPSAWTLSLQRVVFSKGQVRVQDAVRHADLTADIDTLASDPLYGVAWKLNGKYNGEPLSGHGKAGAVLSLRRQSTPYPISAAIRAGSTAIVAEGTLTRPTELAALDMRLKVSGVSMARLYPLTGIVLPETPPFATEGHLLGTLGPGGGHWVYDKFSGKVGASDIGGKLEFRSINSRPLLTGAITSRLLNFGDLAPLIGADSNASKTARGAPVLQPPGKVLPVEPFKTERWTSIDADVAYHAGKIIRDKDLPISDLNTHFILKDGVLSLKPLNFDIAGGKLTSEVRLDGSGKGGKKAIRADLKASARHLKLKQLFPRLLPLQASIGEINGDAKLSATGNSVASLLGSSNGEVKTLINQGTISKLLLEEMGLNIGNVVLARLFGDKQVKLNCMATDFAVSDGLMHTRSFMVDTEEAILHVSGDVSLAEERLDLTIRPDTKGFRVFSLRAPLYVRGSFERPRVSIDKGVLAMRAGGALALAAVAPFAALLPLVNAGPGENSECASLLANARVKPVAPPAGKTMRMAPAR